MNRNLILSLVMFVAVSACSLAYSQDDPLAEKKPGGKAAAGPKVDPLGKPDLVIESIRDADPATPEALMQAVQTLLDYGAPEEAKKYLTKLMAIKPDAGVLTDLQRRFGSAFFMQLQRDTRMAPEGARLSKAVLDAALAAARDPMRLTSLVELLKDPAEGTRRDAVVELSNAGQYALPPLLNALADGARADEHAGIRDALLELDQLSVEPLIGALESADDAFRARAIDTLGRLHARRALLYLVGPYLSENSSPELRKAARQALQRIIGETPTHYDGEQYLLRRAKLYLDGEPPIRPNFEGFVDLWHWDGGQQVPVPRRYRAQDAALISAARAAADLYAIAPKNPDYRRLYLTAGLEMQKLIGGYDNPMPQGAGTIYSEAKEAGIKVVEEVLAQAIKNRHVAAAAGACEVLGNIGSPALVVSQGDWQPPLVQALRHGERRLRFAAAQAILKLDPHEAYPGSSHVMETLGYVVSTAGTRRALVVHPQAGQAQSLVGLLNEIGFEADAAATGRRGFQLAADGTDYELVLISDAVDGPDANELLQMLRRDPRTARLPAGLMFRADTEQRVRRIAESDPLSQAITRPHSAETLGFDVSRILARAGRHVVGPDTRLAHATIALDHLKRLVERADEYRFYDFLRQERAIETALFNPELTDKAAAVLGQIGSPLAQRALVGVASQNALPLAQRQAAAAGFVAAVQKRGTLLTTAEIATQYDLYNKSETLDAETQAVMASLLDAIETRAKLNNPEPPPAPEKAE